MTSRAVERISGRFLGKTVVVSAAAKGIGRTCCVLMGREGATIAAIDTDIAALETLSAELRRDGIRLMPLHADALDQRSVGDAVATVAREFGRVDILVNGVGGSTIHGSSTCELDKMELAEFEGLVRFNLNGVFLLGRAVIPIMKAQKAGCIVNISSIAARGTAFSNAAYSAAKAGVVALTAKLALELAPHGIRCNAIAPGLTMTERMSNALAGASREEMAKRAGEIPLRRFSTAEDQAKVICFLASSDAGFITGTTIYVTGGV